MEETKSITAEENVEVVENQVQEGEAEKEPIPEELQGVDEDIAREAMEEAKRLEEEKAKEENAESAEGKQGEKTNIAPVSYDRFKKELDARHAQEKEIADLKAELERLRNGGQPQREPQQAQPQPQQSQQYQIPEPQPQLDLSKENAELLDKVVNETALQMTGMTQEEVDALEYADEGDPQTQRWKYAKELAKDQIFNKIRQAQAAQIQAQRNFIEARNKAVADFNEFAGKESKEKDFEAVKDYAINGYFQGLDPVTQNVVATAYARVESNNASPQEIYIIKNYFAQAKAAYREAQQKAIPQTTKNQPVFPRSGNINGTSDLGNDVTVATLEKMLDTMPFDKIDPKYQKLLLGN